MMPLNQRVFYVIVVLVLGAAGGLADPYPEAPPYDPNVEWCPEGPPVYAKQHGYPSEGRLVQVGSRFLRLCRRGDPGVMEIEDVTLVKFNPARVRGLSNGKSMIGLGITNHGDFQFLVDRILDSYVEVSDLEIGGQAYTEYSFFSDPKDQERASRYFFPRSINQAAAGSPSFLVRCSPTEGANFEYGDCRLTIPYGTSRVSLLFLRLLVSHPEIPVEKFPEFAEDMRKIMEAADVTEDYLAGKIELPFTD